MKKCENFIGMVKTTEGFMPHKFYEMPLNNVQDANKATGKCMGFKIIYGCTEDGKVYEFMKAGNWAKRDLDAMKAIGVIEAGSSLAFAPKRFETNQGMVEVTMSFDIGKDTQDMKDRWLRALS